MKRVLILCLLTIGCVELAFSQTSALYVDAVHGSDRNAGTYAHPVQTMQEVQKRLNSGKFDSASRLNIILRSGVYRLSSPLTFSSKENGKASLQIVISAAKGAQPILSGALRITHWHLFDKAKNIYAASLPRHINGRQLFVDGVRAMRARETDIPHRWIKYDSIGHLTSDLSLLKWKNPQDVECVYREIWTAPRCGVASITQVGDTLVRLKMKQPGWSNCQHKGVTSTHNPWYMENAFELLDEGGEWYLDRTGAIGGTAYTIYYKPRAWESMATSDFEFPVLENLVHVEGSIDHQIADISFKGIEFGYTTWLRPSFDRGNADAQNNVLRQYYTKEGEWVADGAAILMKHAHHICISNCSFMHLGGNGLTMLAGCTDNAVKSSLFFDISATAIQLGGYRLWDKRESENAYDPIDRRNILSRDTISGNHIEDCGIEYRSATGIAAVFPSSCRFEHNTLRNLPYSGFHIGWAWTTVPYTVSGDNVISSNWVQNVMIEVADGGSIYTLGGGQKEHPSIIENNYLTRTMWGQGVYMDNGSAYYHIRNNVFDRIDDYNVKINSGSHDIDVHGIYSNKVKNVISKPGCTNDFIDTTYIYSASVQPTVDAIRTQAGDAMPYKSVWQSIADRRIYELEDAEVTGHAYTTAGIGTKVYDYSGSGFISGFERGGNSSIVCDVLTSKAGRYRLDLRYSADKEWCDKMRMEINGKTSSLSLQPSARSQWRVLSQTVNLPQGISRIKIYNEGNSSKHLFWDVMLLYPVK